jgi:hypothetical protein
MTDTELNAASVAIGLQQQAICCISWKRIEIKIYRTVILSVVLYGCKTWSPTLREEHRLRVSENRVEEDIWT